MNRIFLAASIGAAALACSCSGAARAAGGATGPTGAAGATGPAGEQGAAGARGPTGAAGAAGVAGAAGSAGATGPAGLAGLAGLDGAAGPAGAAGPQGPDGAAGAQGAQGARGGVTVLDKDGAALGQLVALDTLNHLIAFRDAAGLIWSYELVTGSIALPISGPGPLYASEDCSGTPYALVAPIRGLVVVADRSGALFEVADVVETITPRTIGTPGRCDALVFGPDGPTPEVLARLRPLDARQPTFLPPFDLR